MSRVTADLSNVPTWFSKYAQLRKHNPVISDVNRTKFLRSRPRPRPIFWSQTGLVLRPTVSDHITASYYRLRLFNYVSFNLNYLL